jgi:hypothetical protein
MIGHLRRLRELRLTRSGLCALSAVSALATGLVVATALGGSGAGSQALALLRRPRVEHVVLPSARAEPAPAHASRPRPKASAPASTPRKLAPAAPTTTGRARTSTAPAPPATSTTTTPASTRLASKVKHIFVIALTTPGYRAAFGPGSAMKYLDRVLRPKGDLLTGYQALGATNLPDRLALISGQAPNLDTERGCTTYAAFPARAAPDKAGEMRGRGCVYPNTVLTLGDQLDAAKMHWKAYVEDLGSTLPIAQQSCQHPDSNATDTTVTPVPGNDYATSENPFVYFHSLLDLGDCTSDDLPLTGLASSLHASAHTANLVYIAPGLCDDGSGTVCPGVAPSGSAAADAFLRRWVPVVLGSPAFRRNGVLLIVLSPAPSQLPAGVAYGRPIRTGALVISRFARAGSSSRAHYTPYSVLRSIEDLFALTPLAGARSAKSFASAALPGAWSTATERAHRLR